MGAINKIYEKEVVKHFRIINLFIYYLAYCHPIFQQVFFMNWEKIENREKGTVL